MRTAFWFVNMKERSQPVDLEIDGRLDTKNMLDWFDLAHDKEKLPAVLKTEIKFWVP